MKKIWIICLIAILSILACGFTRILISSINGREYGRFWNSKSVSRSENTIVREESLSIENIEDLEIIFTSSDVRLIISDEPQIKIIQYSNSKENARELNIDRSSTKIKMEEERKIYFFAILPTNLYDIYIPKTYTNNFKLEAASSTVEANDNITLKNIDIILASGDIEFKNLLKFEDLNIFTASGDINIDNLEGKKYNINTTSGDTTINTLNCEDGNLKSVSGEIIINTATSNEVEIETTSGDIEIKNLQGKVKTKTISGEVEIDNIQGYIEGTTTSGDIQINKFLVSNDSRIHTVSGEVEIYLDSTSNVNIDTKTTSGDVNFPNGRNTIGVEPYNKLYIETTSGDIIVR